MVDHGGTLFFIMGDRVEKVLRFLKLASMADEGQYWPMVILTVMSTAAYCCRPFLVLEKIMNGWWVVNLDKVTQCLHVLLSQAFETADWKNMLHCISLQLVPSSAAKTSRFLWTPCCKEGANARQVVRWPSSPDHQSLIIDQLFGGHADCDSWTCHESWRLHTPHLRHEILWHTTASDDLPRRWDDWISLWPAASSCPSWNIKQNSCIPSDWWTNHSSTKRITVINWLMIPARSKHIGQLDRHAQGMVVNFEKCNYQPVKHH